MSKSIFREKNMERVVSPEQLNDYIRVTNPSVWFVLSAILIFLASICIWSVVGTLDTTIEQKAYAEEGIIYCYLNEEETENVEPGQTVYSGTQKGQVKAVSELPMPYEDVLSRFGDERIVHVLGVGKNDWCYEVEITNIEEKEGILDVSVVTESIRPISYIFH